MKDYINISKLSFLNVFNDLSFSIDKNKIIGIASPSSQGKTLLCKILDKKIIYKGNILINNKNIKDYKINEYYNMIDVIIPNNISFRYDTLNDNIIRYKRKDNLKEYNKLIKNLHLKNILDKKINELNIDEVILIQIFISLISDKEIIILDDIYSYLDNNLYKEIILLLKSYTKNKTIIIQSNKLKYFDLLDYIYILSNSKIILEGIPKDVLLNDNILSKIGLELPFVIDLSVKLIDYNLLDELTFSSEEVIDKIWK